MKKKLFALLLAVMFFGQVVARDNGPDFNFPKDVTKQAQADLKQALAKGDGALVVDALIRSSLAKSSITIENMSEIIDDIDQIARKESRPDIRALLLHLEARVMHDYSMRFTPIDRRNHDDFIVKPSKTVQDKYAYWDSRQFARALDSLVTLSVSDRAALLQHPIKEYSKILRYDNLGAKYVPTLYHFLCFRGEDLVSSDLKEKLNKDMETASPEDLTATVFAKCNRLGNYRSYQKEYQAVYEEFANVAEGGLPLSFLSGDEHYDKFRQYVKQFPNSIYANEIRNSITYIERKNAKVTYDGHLNSKVSAHAEQAAVKVNLNVRNVNDLRVGIYRLPEDISTDAWDKKDLTLKDLTLVTEQNVHINGTVPFEDKAELTFAALPYGKYIVVPIYKNNGKDVVPQSFSKRD